MRYRPGRTKQEEIGIGWINKRKITKVYKIPIGLAQKEGGGEEGISSWPIVDQSLGWRSLVIDRLSPSFFRPTRILVFGEFFLFDPMPYPSCVHDTWPGYIFHKNKGEVSTGQADIIQPAVSYDILNFFFSPPSSIDPEDVPLAVDISTESSGRVGKQPLRPTSS
ncbi:hypothetical protein PVK06_049909 [Gossypium arboreum]|uniref:Uncharacterized protein n=1 Tax=Gossypium arboreum TaxID=29729 RepID=A0ABR0M9E0_GOSAR|nr:hypothetical protein PVK06_049909 [Gossypium arboreum]